MKLSIKAKIILSCLTVTTVTLLIVHGVQLFLHHRDLERRLQEDSEILAGTLAEFVVVPVMFDDRAEAAKTLRALDHYAAALSASAVNKKGEKVAEYKKSTREIGANDLLTITKQLTQGKEEFGTFTLVFSKQGIQEEMARSFSILPLLFSSATIVAWLFASQLSRVIAKPIVALGEGARAIQATKDYSLRVLERTHDEIGEFTDAFNEMLGEIQHRDSELQTNQRNLELRVLERTKELQAEQEQLQIVIQTAPVAIALLDMNMRYLAASDRWKADFNLTESVLGRSHFEVFPDLPERWKEVYRRCLAGETISSNEDKFERIPPLESMYLRWTVQPWKTPEGAISGVIIVTQRIDDLISVRELAIQNLKIRGQFFANMSHELRTPMNGVLGFTDLLSETPLTNTQKEFVDTIRDSGKLMLSLVDDLLDFQKLEMGKLTLERERFDPRVLVTQVQKILSPTVESKGITLSIAIARQVPSLVVGDARRIQQVLMNLAGNAVKFTSSGGVVIEVGMVPSQDETHGNLTIAIKDSGIGIPKDKIGALFNAFSQVDSSITRRFGGSGLGLAISKQLCNLMGGELTVESTLGKGSTFTAHATVELIEEEFVEEINKPITTEITSNSSSAVRSEPKTILVAEDNPVNRKLIEYLLEIAGYKTVVAENGIEAVNVVKSKHVDLVLMDMQMPEMGGIEATKIIRTLDGTHGKIPIVALTAHALNEHQDQCLEAGMNAFLVKPINRKKLLETLQHYLVER